MRRVMTCAEAEELLGSYALDALPETERASVQEHLETCDEHRAAANELKQVTPLLALTVDEREASPELRQRIIDAVRREPAGREGIPAQPARLERPPRGAFVPAGSSLRRWLLRPRMAALAAAAVLLLGIGVVIGRVVAQPATSAQIVAYSFNGNGLAPAARAQLVYVKNQGQAIMQVTGLPALQPGQVYEIWLFTGGTPVDAGVASTSGQLLLRIDRQLEKYQQVAITIEPGEQSHPTSSPILVGRLS